MLSAILNLRFLLYLGYYDTGLILYKWSLRRCFSIQQLCHPVYIIPHIFYPVD